MGDKYKFIYIFMLGKYPFLKEYKVNPFSNNGFINKIILLLIVSLALFFFLGGFLKIMTMQKLL